VSEARATIDALLRMQAGGAVEIRDHLYHVRGTLVLTEKERSWRELYLDDRAGDQRWLAVEGPRITLWSEPGEVGGLPVETGADRLPDLPTLHVDGVTYARQVSGTATFRVEGSTPFAETGWLEYADYRADDGRYLALELFDGGSVELSSGELVASESLRIFQSPGA
jgi:Domain of unknown function (DUF4178)